MRKRLRLEQAIYLGESGLVLQKSGVLPLLQDLGGIKRHKILHPMAYTYQSLPQNLNTIRVLELHPGQEEDEVRCDLIETSLPTQGTTAYEALSYCWGDTSSRIAIFVDGAHLGVTTNLHSALRRLRFEAEKRRLWIDAVCINQDDETEKGQQVRIMREIYQHASRTLVWLGEGSESTARGFRLIPRLLNAQKLKEQEADDRSLQHLGSEGRKFYNLPSQYAPEWRGFLAIFDVPYFRRVWIIQEVAVAPSVTVLCGLDSIPWNDLVDAVSACHDFGVGVLYEMFSTRMIGFISAARLSVQAKVKWNLLELLVRYRSFCATNQKDKIYALLGLVDRDHLEDNGIAPDYRKEYTVEHTYMDVARYVLQMSSNLDLLSVPGVAETNPSSLQLPSWVPDWSSPPEVSPLIGFWTPKSILSNDDLARQDEESVQGDNEMIIPSFSAAGSSKSQPVFKDGGKAVGLRGYSVDIVDGVGLVTVNQSVASPSNEGFISAGHVVSMILDSIHLGTNNSRAWMNWESLTGARLRETYVTGEPMLDAYWKTFLGGHTVRAGDGWAEERDRWEDLVREYRLPCRLHLHHWLLTYGIFLGAMLFLKVLQQAVFGIYASRAWPTDLRSPKAEVTLGRRMFTTRHGYIGLGPKRMQGGDLIALFEGGRVPFIIRQEGQKYKLIGECYIHGIMSGERFEEGRCEVLWII